MSETITEPVSEEDEIAAQMTPDDDGAPDDETPDEPPEEIEFEEEQSQGAALTEKEIERRQKSLEKESERHEKRINEILGPDAEGLVKCEACPPTISGYHYGPEDYPPGSPDRILYEMLRGGEEALPKQPEFLRTCESCNGLGEWKTGSRKSGCEWLTCSVCKSVGYVDTRSGAPVEPHSVADEGETAVLAPSAAVTEPDADMWGRPVGHERYGKFPIYLTSEERAADLAEGFKIE